MSTENLSTLSAQHARREDESIVDAEVAKLMFKEDRGRFRSPETKSRPDTPIFRRRQPSPRKSLSPIDEMDEIYYQRARPRATAPSQSEHTVFVPGLGNLIPVPKYNMKDIAKWIEKYEYISRANDWSKADMFQRLYTAFDGTPHLEYFIRLMNKKKSDGKRIIIDWDTAKKAFLKRKPENEALINAETIYQIKQQADEDAVDYITRKENLLAEIKPNLPEEFIVPQIVPGLRTELYDDIMKSSIKETIKTVDELVNRIIPIEQLVRTLEQRATRSKNKRLIRQVEFDDEAIVYGSTDLNPYGQKEDKRFNYVQSQFKAIRQILANQNRNDYSPRNNYSNGNDYQPRNQYQQRSDYQPRGGYQRRNWRPRFFRNSYQRPNPNVPAIETQPPDIQPLAIENKEDNSDKTNVKRDIEGRPECYYCHDYGHFSRECPKKRNMQNFSRNYRSGNFRRGAR